MTREISLTSREGLVAWFLADAYIYDWLAAGILIIINLTVPGGAIKPVDRAYTLGDPSLSYPDRNSTISSSVLYALAFAFPLIVYIAASVYKKSFHDL